MATSSLSHTIMEKMVGRLTILREICEAKDTLFGPFSSERTMLMKMKVWTDILVKAKSLGLVAPCKDYKYMRDVYWQNIKRNSLSRRNDKKHSTTPIDSIVYEIIDNTSTLHIQSSLRDHQKYILNGSKPMLNNIVLLKSDNSIFDTINEEVDVTIEEVDHLKVEPAEELQIEETEDQSAIQDESEMKSVGNTENDESEIEYEPIPEKSDDANDRQGAVFNRLTRKMEEGKMKKRKVQLEIEFLELQNYKTQLEVLDLEQKLGIDPSKFTKEIAKKRKRNKIVFENEDDGEDSDL